MAARRLFSLLLGAFLVLTAVVPAYAYNGQNKLHVRMSQPQHAECGEPAPVVANVATARGDPAPPGTQVTFIKHHGYAGEALVPTTDGTDASGNAESTYTIPCGAKPGARVIKACEPSGACGTTVVVCRPKDGCTAPGNAGSGFIVAKAGATAGQTSTDATAPMTVAQPAAMSGPPPATLPPLLNLLGVASLGLLAIALTRGRPKGFRSASAA